MVGDDGTPGGQDIWLVLLRTRNEILYRGFREEPEIQRCFALEEIALRNLKFPALLRDSGVLNQVVLAGNFSPSSPSTADAQYRDRAGPTRDTPSAA